MLASVLSPFGPSAPSLTHSILQDAPESQLLWTVSLEFPYTEFSVVTVTNDDKLTGRKKALVYSLIVLEVNSPK